MKLIRNIVERVLRGGSAYFDAGDLCSTVQDWSPPAVRYKAVGFRFVIRG